MNSNSSIFPISKEKLSRQMIAAAAVLLVSLAVMPFELPLWLDFYTGVIRRSSVLSNPALGDIGLFSDIFGLAICVVLIAIFDKRRRSTLLYLLVAAAITYFTAHVLKEVFGRARPLYAFPVEVLPPGTQYDQELAVELKRGAETWVPVWTGRPLTYSPVRSFPSGHAGTAVVMALYLTLLYRRFWVLWWGLALGVALTRFVYLWHFPSDVVFACAAGWLFALWVFTWRWPAKAGMRLFRQQAIEQVV